MSVGELAFNEKFGPWALIAGGGQGIGAAFARYIASQGVNLVLVDCNAEPLASFCAEMSREYGVQTLPVVQDLAAPDMLQQLTGMVGDREIGLLIYNAALADVGPFFKPGKGLDYELRKLAINVTGPLSLLHHFAQPMLARQRGGVILMSSGTGLMGAPYYAHYGATKAYSINLAEGLWHEFKPYNVAVLACIAGMTRSSSAEAFLERGDGTSLVYQSCEELVEEAFQVLGKQPSLICGEANRRNMGVMATLPKEQALGLLASHAIDNFLGGTVPPQAV